MVVDDSSVGLSREPHVEGSTALLRIPQVSLVHFLCSPLRDCTHNCSSAGPHLRAHSPQQTRHLPGASFEPTLAPCGALCVDLSQSLHIHDWFSFFAFMNLVVPRFMFRIHLWCLSPSIQFVWSERRGITWLHCHFEGSSRMCRI
jgi:hypothetical protein